jgi:hypothetical protein
VPSGHAVGVFAGRRSILQRRAPERFAVFLSGKMVAGLRRAFVEAACAADAVNPPRQD